MAKMDLRLKNLSGVLSLAAVPEQAQQPSSEPTSEKQVRIPERHTFSCPPGFFSALLLYIGNYSGFDVGSLFVTLISMR
ncbi:hypothetical protein Nepgr_010577 [Nepenthes gracilis]|uniref:Uncharacterized protein n=1 Tax=Nepenthes gracilis TaxID=150966 RepID=A0AAD3SCY3_NEPGR|nr:hypothetical protein Nepgr_010577 [Nepenthes gracilis]